jgi:hypothetical protein
MKKTLTLILSVLVLSLYGQIDQQNSIEKLINSHGITFEISIEEKHQITEKENLIIKKYNDLTNDKVY